MTERPRGASEKGTSACGISLLRRLNKPPSSHRRGTDQKRLPVVIPAKAGIHLMRSLNRPFVRIGLDSRLRGNDMKGVGWQGFASSLSHVFSPVIARRKFAKGESPKRPVPLVAWPVSCE